VPQELALVRIEGDHSFDQCESIQTFLVLLACITELNRQILVFLKQQQDEEQRRQAKKRLARSPILMGVENIDGVSENIIHLGGPLIEEGYPMITVDSIKGPHEKTSFDSEEKTLVEGKDPFAAQELIPFLKEFKQLPLIRFKPEEVFNHS
jgi:hypothetical protein